jgi:type IV secretion system protein VirD4
MVDHISHGLLRLAVFFACMSLVIFSILYWPVAAFVIVGLAYKSITRPSRLTTLGSARWADEKDLERAGMTDANSGLILGRYYVGKSVTRAVSKLFCRRLSPAKASLEFFGFLKSGHSVPIRLPQAVHTAVFCPTGGGKGVSCVIPFLLNTNESCVVFDPKGENARITAQFRRDVLGHRIVLLDPFKIVTDAPDSFNPLDFIDVDDPLAIDACQELANAIVVRAAEEREPHFSDAAEMFIASMLALFVRHGDRNGFRSLQTVREFLAHPKKLDRSIDQMRSCNDWQGMLARMGDQLSHFIDREKGSALTTVSRHLRFLDTPIIAASTHSSTFDPAALRTGKMTIYLVLPPEYLRSQAGLLRLWVSSLLRSVVRTGLNERNRVHFILDEAASLGQLNAIEDAVDKYRGYGVRLQFYFQSLGQLKKCFPNGGEQTLLSNTSQVFMAVNDIETAELVSKRLGDSTIMVEGSGSNSGSSRQYGGNNPPTESYSNGSSRDWKQQTRKLLNPDEVIGLHPRLALTFTPGLPPICTFLIRYYEEAYGHRPTPFAKLLTSGRTLLVSAALLAFSVLVTYGASAVGISMLQSMPNSGVYSSASVPLTSP